MGTETLGAAVSAARRAGEAIRSGASHAGETEPRWHVMTVCTSAEEVAPGGKLPEPLARLGDAIDTELRPAPGERGTELASRLHDKEHAGLRGTAERVTGHDTVQELRTALRQAKALRRCSPPTRRPPGGWVPTSAG
ncbi:hypothetical protein ACFQMH_06815 [Streptomyces viridiviolaceus]|uniref:Uncharacterized protein n=1 Tax=Streptomyces viridiviolaceus TaxID=68282 RepID=A0ABW2DXJ5_9ACTN|nr:hypothetical protein [Streptomyces viridiviolaceus]